MPSRLQVVRGYLFTRQWRTWGSACLTLALVGCGSTRVAHHSPDAHWRRPGAPAIAAAPVTVAKAAAARPAQPEAARDGLELPAELAQALPQSARPARTSASGTVRPQHPRDLPEAEGTPHELVLAAAEALAARSDESPAEAPKPVADIELAQFLPVQSGQPGPLPPAPLPDPDAAGGLEADPGRATTAIDLSTALALTAGQNPQVQFAHARIREAFAQRDAAESLWLPSIRAGVNYHYPDGRIQDVEGNVIETSRSSLYSGLGSQAVGAGSPAVPGVAANFHLSDAIFVPRIARQTAAARQHAAGATTNDQLLTAALGYLELLNAAQRRAIAEETATNARTLVDLTRAFAQSGQGSEADADRAAAELSSRETEVERATEAVEVASARLAQALSTDPTVLLVPLEPTVVPIELVSAQTEVRDLVAQGLRQRPELAESQYLVGAAIERFSRERYAPLVPSLFLGASYGGQGGGLGGNTTGNFGDRVDLDAAAYWEIRNLGFGEQAARDRARSQVDQARWQQVQVCDRVAREITEAHAQVQARARQMATAQAGIEAAQRSYQRNVDRIRDAQGLPIEVLQSIVALDAARRDYLRAVVDYNEAQFRLHRALGWPIQ